MTDTITLPRSVVEQALEHLTCPVDEPVREAFRAALEQPQSMTDCHQSQPQGEQEPVAWMHQCRKKPELVKLSFKKREPALAASGYKARPLIFGDTAKPRQPLTREEIAFIAAACGGLASDFVVSVARAIEAAHGVKGRK